MLNFTDFIFDVNWELLISTAITIVGFIVTYLSTKRNLKNEIEKNKVSISLEKMEDIPFEIANLFNNIQNGKLDVNAFSALLSKIYSYCSSDAIKIVSQMQRINYRNADNADAHIEEKYRVMTLLSLLISQIKYDLTGEVINPEFWFIMKIKDYYSSNINKTICQLINQDVDELNLLYKFKPKHPYFK